MDNGGNTVNVTTDGTETTAEPRKGPGCGCIVAVLVFLLAGGGITAYLAGTFALRQEKATGIEETMADLGVRTVMIDGSFTDWPMPATAKQPQAIAAGKDLFGAECSLCHGQGGKGDGSFGKTMFPPAANLLSDRTRTKTDGQLYWLIWHGINYTGMPAFGEGAPGGAHNQSEIWSLVAYIRSLQGSLAAAK